MNNINPNKLILLCILVCSKLHCHTIVQFVMYVNNVEVTVNTSTCTDVQQGTNQVKCNSYSIGDQGFMAARKQTLLSAATSDLVCLLPCHQARRQLFRTGTAIACA